MHGGGKQGKGLRRKIIHCQAFLSLTYDQDFTYIKAYSSLLSVKDIHDKISSEDKKNKQ